MMTTTDIPIFEEGNYLLNESTVLNQMTQILLTMINVNVRLFTCYMHNILECVFVKKHNNNKKISNCDGG